MKKDIIKVNEKVESILSRYAETRDSDKKLWLAYNVIYNDLKNVLGEANYYKFRKWLLQEKTPVFESLSRCRRKIQENRPELEGNKSRRLEEEKEIRDMMR